MPSFVVSSFGRQPGVTAAKLLKASRPVAYTETLYTEAMTVSEARAWLVGRLRAVGVPSAEVEADLLLEALLKTTRADLVLARRQTLSAEQERTLSGWLERRLSREPLQHVLGVAHFYGLELAVTPDVLIPRPETERLVELALETVKNTRNPRVLDVGTGSGAVALACKHGRPDAVVLATDVSSAALEVAAANGRRCGLEVAFVLSDLLAAPAVQVFAARLDLLVANLPYLPAADRGRVSPEVRRDPDLALYSGPDGLTLFRRLQREAHATLKKGATALFELDPRNVHQARRKAQGWAASAVLPDLAGRERFLRLLR